MTCACACSICLSCAGLSGLKNVAKDHGVECSEFSDFSKCLAVHIGLSKIVVFCLPPQPLYAAKVWTHAALRVQGIAPVTQQTTRQKNESLLRHALPLNLLTWRSVEGAVGFMNVPEIMDGMQLSVEQAMPPGHYQFFPFASPDNPFGPEFCAEPALLAGSPHMSPESFAQPI